MITTSFKRLQEMEFMFVQIARDSKDRLFTWGFGGYGRLGHQQPKDELIPRLVSFFKSKSKYLSRGAPCYTRNLTGRFISGAVPVYETNAYSHENGIALIV